LEGGWGGGGEGGGGSQQPWGVGGVAHLGHRDSIRKQGEVCARGGCGAKGKGSGVNAPDVG